MPSTSIWDQLDIGKSTVTFLFGLLSTAIGFFLALYFNRRIDRKKELIGFSNMIKTIQAEMRENIFKLKNSFEAYLNGIIFNDLSTQVSIQFLTDATFLKYANIEIVTNLQAYISSCNLCNYQKTYLKDLRIEGKPNKWEDALQDALDKTIKNTYSSAEKALDVLETFAGVPRFTRRKFSN
jgi:hypothetical protein